MIEDEEEKPSEPVSILKKVTSTGEIKIEFSEVMNLRFNLSDFAYLGDY